MKKTNPALYLLVLCGFAVLLAFPAEAQEAVRHGLRVCGTAVIPALFPFFVLTRFFLNCRVSGHPPRWAERLARCFGISGACLPALGLSFLGGYPVGAATVSSLYEAGAISKREAEHALCFCNNSGPAFFIGVIGGVVLGSVRLGLLLFLAHILAALLCGLLFAPRGTPSVTVRRLPDADLSLGQGFLNAVSASCLSLLQISGLVLFFSVLLAVLEAVGLFSILRIFPAAEARALLNGALELSSGILCLQGTPHSAQLAAFLMGWGGLCVHMQAASLWKPAGLRPKRYLLSKFLHGLFSALIVQTFLTPTPQWLAAAILLAAFCVIFPRFQKNRSGNSRRYAL